MSKQKTISKKEIKYLKKGFIKKFNNSIPTFNISNVNRIVLGDAGKGKSYFIKN